MTDKTEPNLSNIKQIKLMNGEEIFCNVQDETKTDIIAKGVLILRDAGRLFHEDGLEARIFSLFPWMTYQQELKDLILISKSAIVGMMIPGPNVLEYYESSLDCLIDICEDSPIKMNESDIERDSGQPNVISFPTRQPPTKH